jgi:glutathione synthase/RimK-type ligase-like ATP-grasp enzyme
MALIYLISYDALPELTPDDQFLMRAITEQGGTTIPVIWTDPEVRWQDAHIAIVRSTWDYFLHPQRFVAWIGQVRFQTKLVNPADLLLWNMHKRYLLELHTKGISIVPTVLVYQADAANAIELAARHFGYELVIKPAISGSSYLTRRFSLLDRSTVLDAEEHLAVVLTHSDALIQPLISEVFGNGERSLVFLNGEFSHAIRKDPFNGGATAGDARTAVIPTTVELEFCQRVLETLPCRPVYARVDTITHESETLLMELELIEPELHFRQGHGSASKLASILMNQ